MSDWLAIVIFGLAVADVAVIRYWTRKSPAARASRLEFPFHLLFVPEQDAAAERARRAAFAATSLAIAAGDAVLVAGVVTGAISWWWLLLGVPSLAFVWKVAHASRMSRVS